MAWVINGSYPYQDTIPESINILTEPYPDGLVWDYGDVYLSLKNEPDMIDVLSEPYPDGLIWYVSGSYPYLAKELRMIPVLSAPYPKEYFLQKQGEYPKLFGPEMDVFGAFRDVQCLCVVDIPESVKNIGEYSFNNCGITYIKIAIDCTYYDTSFPNSCKIEFYS